MNASTTDVHRAEDGARPGTSRMGIPPQESTRAAGSSETILPVTGEARELLESCIAQFGPDLESEVRAAVNAANHLFDTTSIATDQEIVEYRSRRGEFVTRFANNVAKLFAQWLAGKRRTERRPDVDASPAALSVLSDVDYAMQETLKKAIANLRRTTRDSVFALDARVACVLGEDDLRKTDNPFAVDYLLDAIGMSLRALFPNPRVHRAVMERVVWDIADAVNDRYVALNRYLATKNILPGAEANVRARSELRPDDDRELLGLFNRLLTSPGKPEPPPPVLADAIEVPDDLVDPAAPMRAAGRGGYAPGSDDALDQFSDPTALVRALGRSMQSALAQSGAAVTHEAGPTPFVIPALAIPSPEVTSAITAAFARFMQAGGPAIDAAARQQGHAMTPGAVPGADGMDGRIFGDGTSAAAGAWLGQAGLASGAVVSGTSGTGGPDPSAADAAIGWPSPMVAVLDQWQRFDPMAESAWSAANESDGQRPDVPLNRIPIIRVAIADKIVDPLDGVTMDVMTLLFDYVFRDPSIPDAMRSLFAGLQVPIAKAALLDRTFFSDKRHPARLLLDNLAAAAVGAHNNPVYLLSLQSVAQGIVTDVCRDFKADVAVFATADARLRLLVDAEHEKVAAACAKDVAAALADEETNLHDVAARAVVVEKLTGQVLPFEVHSFVETIWANYLSKIHARQGPDGEDWRNAVQTLDDLLWSLTSTERTAQRARMSVLIPVLIRKLRAGCVEVNVDRERSSGFFDALYRHHIGALKPNSEAAFAASETASVTAANDEPARADASGRRFNVVNVHGFVSEMAVGTWLTFRRNTEKIFARLFWISPNRTKFVFTTRSRALALILTPEELAWELGTDRAALVIEPVPMYDRAINAALNTLAANQEFVTTH